jgi:1,4-dihydroxy-2-naphthoyl-CoA synthase
MARTMDRLDANKELRVCILRGAEGTFSSGTDLRAHRRGESMVVEPRGFYGFLGKGPRVPVIAAVEGYAVGGGFEIVLGCDLVVAAQGQPSACPRYATASFLQAVSTGCHSASPTTSRWKSGSPGASSPPSALMSSGW